MSDEAAFLEALKANPADDTARLVYADWLDEHDQPQKAEYLRAVVACAAANGVVPDSLIDLAEQLPRDWRIATAARFALRLEWRESGRKIHAIKFVREVTGMGLGEAKQFVECESDGSFFLMTAEDADAIARHRPVEGFTVSAEVEPLLGRRAPSSGTFAVSASLGPAPGHDWPDHDFEEDALISFREFVATALGITTRQVDERFSAYRFTYCQISHGHSLRQAHAEMARLLALLPPDDPTLLPLDNPNRYWKINLTLTPRVT